MHSQQRGSRASSDFPLCLLELRETSERKDRHHGSRSDMQVSVASFSARLPAEPAEHSADTSGVSGSALGVSSRTISW